MQNGKIAKTAEAAGWCEKKSTFLVTFSLHLLMKKTRNAKEIISEKYGKEGSVEREKFREDAFAYYFGEIIKSRRKKLNMSQERLAQKVGKKRPYISRLENGEDIRLSNFSLIANALGLTIELKEIKY